MIGFFKNQAIFSAAKRIGAGILKETPILGQIYDNIKSDDGGHGKFDWYKLIGSLVPITILLYYLSGKISMEVLEKLMKIFG